MHWQFWVVWDEWVGQGNRWFPPVSAGVNLSTRCCLSTSFNAGTQVSSTTVWTKFFFRLFQFKVQMIDDFRILKQTLKHLYFLQQFIPVWTRQSISHWDTEPAGYAFANKNVWLPFNYWRGGPRKSFIVEVLFGSVHHSVFGGFPPVCTNHCS